VIETPHLSLDFSSFAMRRSWVRIPSRPPKLTISSVHPHSPSIARISHREKKHTIKMSSSFKSISPLLIATLFFCSANVFAQSVDKEQKESLAVVELGGAANWSVKGGGSSFGPTVALDSRR